MLTNIFTLNLSFLECLNWSLSCKMKFESLLSNIILLIIQNFTITKGYSHSFILRLQVSRTFRFHITIPLTSKTLMTHRSIRKLIYFFSRFIGIVNLSWIILPKISKFSNVLISCSSVVVSKKIPKILGKVSNLCSKEFIIKSINIIN